MGNNDCQKHKHIFENEISASIIDCCTTYNFVNNVIWKYHLSIFYKCLFQCKYPDSSNA